MININLYRKFNPDLKSFNNNNLLNHYNKFGIYEKRVKCIETFFLKYPNFDIDSYKKEHTEINNKIDLMVHWHIFGNKEKKEDLGKDENKIVENKKKIKKIEEKKIDIKKIDVKKIDVKKIDENKQNIVINDIFWKQYEELYYYKSYNENSFTFIIISDNENLIKNLISNIKNYFKWNILVILNGIDFFMEDIDIIKIEKVLNCEIDLIKKFFLNFIKTRWFIFLENTNILNKNFSYIFDTELNFNFEILIMDKYNIIYKKETFLYDLNYSNGHRILNYKTIEFKNDRIYELKNKMDNYDLDSFIFLSKLDVKKELIGIYILEKSNNNFIINSLNKINNTNIELINLNNIDINIPNFKFIKSCKKNYESTKSLLLMCNYIIIDNLDFIELLITNYFKFKKIFLNDSNFNNEIKEYPNNFYFLNGNNIYDYEISTNNKQNNNYKINYNNENSKIGKYGIIYYKNNFYYKNINKYSFCDFNKLNNNILFDYITINNVEKDIIINSHLIKIFFKINILFLIDIKNIKNLELNLFKIHKNINYNEFDLQIYILTNNIDEHYKKYIIEKYCNIILINNDCKSYIDTIYEIFSNSTFDSTSNKKNIINHNEELQDNLILFFDNKSILTDDFSLYNINYHFFLNNINFTNIYSNRFQNIIILKKSLLNKNNIIEEIKIFFKNRTFDFLIEDLIIFFKSVDKNYYLFNEDEFIEYKFINKNNEISKKLNNEFNKTINLDNIKIYLINLDKRVDRLNESRDELLKIGLNNFERFSGIIPNHEIYKNCKFINPEKLLFKNNIK